MLEHPALRFIPRALAVILLASLAAALVSQPTAVQRTAAWWRDLPLRTFTPKAEFSGVLALDIAVDDFAKEATQYGLVPYRRETLGRVAKYLLDEGANVVAFDLLFCEPAADDDALAGLLAPGMVLAAAALPFYPRAIDLPRRDPGSAALAINDHGTPPARLEWTSLDLPSPALLASNRARIGVLNYQTDDDGRMRRQPMVHAAGNVVLPSLPLAAFLAAARVRDPIESRDGRLTAGMYAWPVTERGEVLLRFPANLRDVPTLSLHRVALAAFGLRSDPELGRLLRDRVIFIGNSSVGGGPVAETPLGRLPGLQLNALAYTQIARGAVATPSSLWWNAPLTMLCLLPGLALLARRRVPQPRTMLAAIGVVLGVAILGAVIAGIAGVVLRWPFGVLAGLTAAFIAATWNWTLLRAKRRQRDTEKRAAEHATRMKTEFLNHLTHELRTPLTAIMGFNKINQFTDELGKDQRIANSAVIARNCEHLLALINNNLDLAKIEAGQLAIQRAPEDPEQIMRDVIATMQALAADKKLELKYVRRTTLPDALVLDAFRLRQILINLMGNAVKFTSRGTVELAVAWHIAALEIEVRDTGPGIAPEALERIWQPFKQADLTVGRRFGGTGLGLAISRKLVEMMGGEITVESKIGVGTMFRVRLPTEAIPRRAATESMPAAVISRDKLTGRVLVADDNEDLRNLVILLLRNLGLQVTAVEHGLAAVETAVADDFDVILMDMEMPVMNGYEAVHVLRTRQYHGTILGLTAHQEGPEVARAILSGCDAVISKPVSLDGLKAALAPVLDRRRAADPYRPIRRTVSHG